MQPVSHFVKCSKIYDATSLDNHHCNIIMVDDFIDYNNQQKNSKKLSKNDLKKYINYNSNII